MQRQQHNAVITFYLHPKITVHRKRWGFFYIWPLPFIVYILARFCFLSKLPPFIHRHVHLTGNRVYKKLLSFSLSQPLCLSCLKSFFLLHVVTFYPRQRRQNKTHSRARTHTAWFRYTRGDLHWQWLMRLINAMPAPNPKTVPSVMKRKLLFFFFVSFFLNTRKKHRRTMQICQILLSLWGHVVLTRVYKPHTPIYTHGASLLGSARVARKTQTNKHSSCSCVLMR